MQVLYSILETLLPFEWVSYDFMKNALLAILLICPLFGILGTMIVNNGMAFFSDALGHSALCGIALGIIFGFYDTDWSMVLFALLFSLALNRIKKSALSSPDTVISVFSSLGVAIGLAVLSKGGNFANYSGLLVGDILSIHPKELLYLLLVLIATLIFWFFCFNQLHAISLNPSLARIRGVRVNLIDDIFAMLTAVIVTLSIRWVGLLIINAMLILPAAAARNISSNMRQYHLYSLLFSLFSGITGLVVSYYGGFTTGPVVVILAAIVFFVTFAFHKKARN